MNRIRLTQNTIVANRIDSERQIELFLGSTGFTGPTGPTGATGIIGPTGPTGPYAGELYFEVRSDSDSTGLITATNTYLTDGGGGPADIWDTPVTNNGFTWTPTTGRLTILSDGVYAITFRINVIATGTLTSFRATIKKNNFNEFSRYFTVVSGDTYEFAWIVNMSDELLSSDYIEVLVNASFSSGTATIQGASEEVVLIVTKLY
jgi:hypothetical protein